MQLSDYNVQIASNTNTFSIKLPAGQSNLQIVQTFLKLDGQYLLIKCKSNLTNHTLTFGGYAFTPKKERFFAKINKELKIIYLIKIKKIFNLCQISTKEDELECELEDQRNKGIIYYQKQLYSDPGVQIKYEYGDLTISNTVQYLPEVLSNFSIPINLYQLIYKARIVNFSVLKNIFNAQLMQIQEMCIYFQGRFILKNKFYSTNLQLKRIGLLNLFNKSEIITYQSAYLILQEDFFLLEEIALKKGNSYFLKGFYEDLQLPSQELELFDEKERILSVLNKQIFVNYAQLIQETGLSLKQIMNCLDDSFFHLSNSTFTLKTQCNLRNSFIKMYTSKKSYRKNELIKELEDKLKCKAEDISRIADLYCDLKGANWVLKE